MPSRCVGLREWPSIVLTSATLLHTPQARPTTRELLPHWPRVPSASVAGLRQNGGRQSAERAPRAATRRHQAATRASCAQKTHTTMRPVRLLCLGADLAQRAPQSHPRGASRHCHAALWRRLRAVRASTRCPSPTAPAPQPHASTAQRATPVQAALPLPRCVPRDPTRLQAALMPACSVPEASMACP